MISIDHKTKKPSKKFAYASILKLQGGGVLSSREIGGLLLYFAPATPKKAKTAMEWLAKAAAVQDVREYLCYVYVNADGVGYGMDGHIAHRAQLEGVAEGYYCPKTLLPITKLDMKYPNVERLYAPREAHYTVEPDALTLNMRPDGIAVYTYEGSQVNKALLDRAMNGEKNEIIMSAVSAGTDVVLHHWRGTTEFGDYLVMGIKE